MWLLVSWLLSFGWDSPIRPSLRAYESSVSHLLVLLSLGIAIVWPLFRLSALNRGGPRVIAFVDFVAIALTLQVVLWPMLISGQWSLIRLVTLDWTLCAWSFVIAACVALGSVSPVISRDSYRVPSGRFARINFRRAFWMFIILLLSMLGPLVSLMMDQDSSMASEMFQWSPISASWWMSTHTLDTPLSEEWVRLIVLSVVGVVAWLGLFFEGRANANR